MMDTDTRDGLQRTYLATFDSFAVVPSDLVDAEIAHNNRHARELLGVLVGAHLLTIQDVNGEGDVWQVANPGTYDNHTREEAESVIDAWLADFINTTSDPAPATPTKRSKTVNANANPAELPACRCECGQSVTNRTSQYRPGHDARHAGQVGRDLITASTAKQRDTLLASLGSDALRAKSSAMLTRYAQKAGTVKVAKVAKPVKPATETPMVSIHTIIDQVSKEFVAAKATAAAKPAPVKATTRKPRGAARKAIPTKVAQVTA